MILNIYAVHDVTAEAFRSIHFCQSDGVATRNFGDAVCNKNPNTDYLRNHPEDYCLYCLGTLDDESGSVEPDVPVRYICRASDFLNEQGSKLNAPAVEPVDRTCV